MADLDLASILGIAFLEQYYLSINVFTGLLQIGKCNIKLKREDFNRYARIRLDKQIIVSPQSDIFVQDRIEGNQLESREKVLEPYKKFNKDDILIAKD